jgi:hypothetical protein
MIARFGVEARLVGSFLRTGGGPRALLVAACTALVSGLLLVALTVVLFAGGSSAEQEQVSALVAEDGLRGGYVFALLLICVAPLALLRQVVRLGTATREQRLAALRLAGATPAEVRRLGAWEVGLPALVGGFLGYLVFGVLRAMFGGRSGGPDAGNGGIDPEVARELHLVPSTVPVAWWHVLVVAACVGLVGVLAGATASRSLAISPLGVSRRAPRSAPRPWGALVMMVGVPLLAASGFDALVPGELATVAGLAALVLGLLGLAPWIAYRVGRGVAARSSTVPILIAGRRLATDARATARAAAAVGAIALVAGGGGLVLAGLPDSYNDEDFGSVEPFYTVTMALAGVVLLVSLVLIIFSMAVHGVESLVDGKRSLAALSAMGASVEDLERAQRWEVGLVALPMAVLGVSLGSAPYLLILPSGPSGYAWIPLVVDAVTVALVWLAVLASTRITRPWLTRAVSPTNLRTA